MATEKQTEPIKKDAHEILRALAENTTLAWTNDTNDTYHWLCEHMELAGLREAVAWYARCAASHACAPFVRTLDWKRRIIESRVTMANEKHTFDLERYGGNLSPSEYIAEVGPTWRTALPKQLRELGAKPWEITAALDLCERAVAEPKQTEHTPTPWQQNGNGIHRGIFCVATTSTPMNSQMDDEGFEIACANAAFIVRACNNHDDLVKACGDLLEIVTDITDLDGDEIARIKAARQALGNAAK